MTFGGLPEDYVLPQQYNGFSTAAYGTVTTPTANAAIATLSGLAAGNYEIQVLVTESGTVAAVDTDNMNLRINGVAVTTLPVDAVANGPLTVYRFPRLAVGAAQNVTVNAIALATTGAVYRAVIIATPVF